MPVFHQTYYVITTNIWSAYLIMKVALLSRYNWHLIFYLDHTVLSLYVCCCYCYTVTLFWNLEPKTHVSIIPLSSIFVSCNIFLVVFFFLVSVGLLYLSFLVFCLHVFCSLFCCFLELHGCTMSCKACSREVSCVNTLFVRIWCSLWDVVHSTDCICYLILIYVIELQHRFADWWTPLLRNHVSPNLLQMGQHLKGSFLDTEQLGRHWVFQKSCDGVTWLMGILLLWKHLLLSWEELAWGVQNLLPIFQWLTWP